MGDWSRPNTSPSTPSPQTPKSLDAQVPYKKWHRTMHATGPPHLWVPNCRLKILFLTVTGWICRCKTQRYGGTVYWFQNPCVSGPGQFKLCCSRVNCIGSYCLSPLTPSTGKPPARALSRLSHWDSAGPGHELVHHQVVTCWAAKPSWIFSVFLTLITEMIKAINLPAALNLKL